MKTLAMMIVLLTWVVPARATECKGIGYKGKDSAYCLKCHNGCPSIHPIKNVKVTSTNCIRVPKSFPLENGNLTCVTCHNMSINNRNHYLLRTSKKPKSRTDFCFECHVRSCYRKFNPHKAMMSKVESQRRKACAYCHSANRPDKSCVGCHTLTPHPGAIEHLKASPNDIKKLMAKGIENLKFSKSHTLKSLMSSKPKVRLVNGKIECITCHDPHPQIAVKANPSLGDWNKIAKLDYEAKLRALNRHLKTTYSNNFNEGNVDLMVKSVKKGKLCLTCHSINSLK